MPCMISLPNSVAQVKVLAVSKLLALLNLTSMVVVDKTMARTTHHRYPELMLL